MRGVDGALNNDVILALTDGKEGARRFAARWKDEGGLYDGTGGLFRQQQESIWCWEMRWISSPVHMEVFLDAKLNLFEPGTPFLFFCSKWSCY